MKRWPIIAVMCLLGLLSATLQAGDKLHNQLADHPSPYLAMHGHDPVAWQDWGEAALEKARKSGRPLFISSGYFACYWCHVMQHESYSDPEVAKWLNEHFIPVKVDRELQPGLDAYLIDFVTATRGHAGWPLNVFLTPDGYPLVGFTYQRRDAFLGLLKRLSKAWGTQRDELERMALKASLELKARGVAEQSQATANPDDLRKGILKQARAAADDLQGGFGNQTKFPMTSQLNLLLDLLAARDDDWLREFLSLTLDNMATRGLRDHLAGGFFRYSVDPSWHTPHFEKMLYSQALLARLYLRAATLLKRPDYRDVARDTLDFLLTSLAGHDGGFIASLSAVDDKGVEGGYYLWSKDELHRLLTPDELTLAGLAWGLGVGAPDDGGWLPRLIEDMPKLAKTLKLSETEVEKRLAALRDKLLKARSKRTLPRDTKQIAAWNGLVLSALADAAGAFDTPRYRRAGQRLHDYLLNRLWDGKKLSRMRIGERSIGVAALADYAYVGAALADWSRATGKPEAALQPLLQSAFEQFADPQGWRNASARLLPAITLTAAYDDGALPSASGVLLDVALRQGGQAIRRRALRMLKSGSGSVVQQPFWYASHAALLGKPR